MIFGKQSFASGVITVMFLSACGNAEVKKNFDRSGEFTKISSGANLSAPSDLTSVVGAATYEGVALANFSEGFGATARVMLVANFDDDKISGTLNNWVDGDPRNHELRGSVELFDGKIGESGTFTTLMAGNLERTIVGIDDTETPLLMIIGGGASGSFYDSLDGELASHVGGEMNGTTLTANGSTGTMTGGFVAVE